MRRIGLVLVIVFAVSILGLAQATSNATVPACPVTPAQNGASGALMPNNSGAYIRNGYATSAAMSLPLVVAPRVTLGVAQANQVGISTANTAAQGDLNAQQIVTVSQTPVIDAGAEAAANAQAAAAQAAEPTSAPARMNLGVATFGSVYDYSGSAKPDTRPLGEVAAQFRSDNRHASRIYTNDDIARLNNNSGNATSAPGSNGTSNSGVGTMPANDSGGLTAQPSGSSVGGQNSALPQTTTSGQPAAQSNTQPNTQPNATTEKPSPQQPMGQKSPFSPPPPTVTPQNQPPQQPPATAPMRPPQ